MDVLLFAGLFFLTACSHGRSAAGAPPPETLSKSTVTFIAPEPKQAAAAVQATRVFPALTFTNPVLALQAPKDKARWFVVEQEGRVRVFDNVPSASSATTFIDISSRVRSGGEMGLLGMAFAPDFAQSKVAYLSYTRGTSQLQSVVSRFKSADGGKTLDPSSEQVLLLVDQPYTNHNGGHLAFGKDGLLYVSVGDGGGRGDRRNNAQNPMTLLGKILRLDVGAPVPYGIPLQNPFATNPRCGPSGGAAACPELYAWGLRNPWRFSFDRMTGELWAGDVGQESWEEIDRVIVGGNYGWRFREGAHCYYPADGCPTRVNEEPLIEPVAEYSHALGSSVTGGFVYRGSALPMLIGHYFFADFGSGRVWSHLPGTKSLQPVELLDTTLSITSFGEDVDGELYLVDYEGGLYQLTVAGASSAPKP